MMKSAYCINLQHRQDRWKQMCDEIRKFPEDFLLHRFDAIYNEKESRIGCAESHLELIKIANRNGMDYIFILEDDVRFTPSSYQKFEKALIDIPDDWDILLGGCYEAPVGHQVNENLYRIYYAQGTHCIFYRRSCYEKILKYKRQPLGIDDYISYLASTNEINLYQINPSLAFQKQGYSDIKKNIFDWNQPSHALSKDYIHYREIFRGISECKVDHLQRHIHEIRDSYLKTQSALIVEKFFFETESKACNAILFDYSST